MYRGVLRVDHETRVPVTPWLTATAGGACVRRCTRWQGGMIMSGGSPVVADAGKIRHDTAPAAPAAVDDQRALPREDTEAEQAVAQPSAEHVAALETVPAEPSWTAEPESRWRGAYQAAAVFTDMSAAILAMFIAFGIRFGTLVGSYEPIPIVLLILFPFAWIAAAGLSRAYEVRVLGAGATEFERLGKAFLQLTAAITFAAYAAHSDLPRGFVLVTLPMTLVLGGVLRYGLRKFVHHRRRAGSALIPVLAVGAPDAVASFSDTLMRNAHNGLRVRAACVIGRECDTDAAVTKLDERAIPLCGNLDSIREAVNATGVTTVAVVDNQITGDRLRWISWQLEGTDTDLVVLPALTEVTGRRLSILQAGELPLLYVAEPEFKGLRRLIKSGFDRLVALMMLVALAPALLVIGLAVRVSSRGPALFFQTRIGKDGKPFRMVKFRSMVDDAEDQLAGLLAFNEVDGGTLFKLKADPRVTRVGRLLRQYSLDELPQLFNVLVGSMSLVGPRPPLPTEVEQYAGNDRRRLLVKPGITGLWQISGRSELSWEESVRIDLRYVENWSLSLDLLVLLKTVGAVVRRKGAY